jgi:hypothetical protein
MHHRLFWWAAVVLTCDGLISTNPANISAPSVFSARILPGCLVRKKHRWLSLAVRRAALCLPHSTPLAAIGARHFGATLGDGRCLPAAIIGLFFGLQGLLLGPIVGIWG